MNLLTQLIPEAERQVEMGTVVPTAGKQKRRRWSKPKRRTKADRIAAEQRLGDELRAKRQAREARWNAEELARQAYQLPEGITAVEHRDGAVR